ncbi:hypothetical protein K2173_009496 [Erythroxylum novogranatense]|uniref:Mechanosensitive ion channel protein n=1 Tax=Erythroxylum novogranatense TaxID=1862640 RepID=A0AAV8U6U7_9ROSI|nr:hypothetical protein K2173_009496 [Erythroxylum novogranatense]
MDDVERGEEDKRSLSQKRTNDGGELAITIPSNGAKADAIVDTETTTNDQSRPKDSGSDISEDAGSDMSEDAAEILRRRSVQRSVYSKPRSYLGESQHSKAQVIEEYDDYEEEIYKKVKSKKEKTSKLKAGILIEWMASLCIMGCFVASLTVEELRKTVIWKLNFWKWCMLGMVTFCGMLATSWLLRVIVFINERNYMMRIKDLPFVHCLKRSVQVFIWIGLVLLVWVCLFNQGVERSETAKKILKLITWTLIALLVGTFFWLLKTVLLEIVSSKFRVHAFFDRIQLLSFQGYILTTLLGPPLIEQCLVGGNSRYGKKYKRVTNRKSIDLGKVYKMKKEEISSWTMKALVDGVINFGFPTVSYDQDDENNEEMISSEMEAIAAAYHIFRNVAEPGCKYISEDDLRRFLPREELDIVFPMFDGWQTGHIDRKSLTDWVLGFYKERKRLAQTLHDTRMATTQLNKVLSAVVVVVTIIIWLLLMNITKSETIAIFLTAAAFAFGNTFKTIFEASIFIFGVHPFDVGDRCVVDGVPLVVEEMDILTTVFLKLDNEKIYYPNSVLATKPISNYYRSPDMGESLEFAIDFNTPMEKIGRLKEKVKRYLETNCSHWYPSHSIVLREMEDESKLKLIIYCTHTMNFHDFAEKIRRRTELVVEMKKIFEELNVQS